MIESLTICVEYDDFLAITLPRNKKHFDETLVITSPEDAATQKLAASQHCKCLVTDAFYRKGAMFNKGLAIEEGFNRLERREWICVWDADIVMPQNIEISNKQTDCLYVPARRLLEDPSSYRDNLDWNLLPSPTLPHEFSGYFQLFHGSIDIPRPWYSTDWIHAGGCDSDFSHKFLINERKRAPFDVLHLGPEGDQIRIGMNWMGRTTQRIDGRNMSPEASRRRAVRRQVILNRRDHGTTRERIKP